MNSRYFDDYVKEFRTSGAISVATSMLVCHQEGEETAGSETDPTSSGESSAQYTVSFTLDSLSDQRPAPAPATARRERPSRAWAAAVNEVSAIRLVFPLSKRAGTSFDYISVGRTQNMDLILALPQVSKFHAYFTRDPQGGFTLADAGSTNGTWLGARRLAVRSPERVNDGDRIRLGTSTFSYLSPDGFVELVKSRAKLGVEATRSPMRVG